MTEIARWSTSTLERLNPTLPPSSAGVRSRAPGAEKPGHRCRKHLQHLRFVPSYLAAAAFWQTAQADILEDDGLELAVGP